MKEIKLEKNQVTRVNTQNLNEIKICHLSDGYYIVSGKNTFGPFMKAFIDLPTRKQNDIYLYGWTAEKTVVFKDCMFGIEKIDEINTESEVSQVIVKNAPSIIQENLPGCTYLGSVRVYKLLEEENGDEKFDKTDRITKKLIPNEKRLIYKTPEDQIISVDPKKSLPYSKYKKIDNFEELRILARGKGLDYSFEGDKTLISNPSLTEFIKNASMYDISDKDIQRVLDQIKTIVGIEKYRKLDFSFNVDFIQHTDINVDEYTEAMNNIDIKDIAMKLFNGRAQNQGVQHIFPKSYHDLFQIYAKEHVVPTLPSTTSFVELKIQVEDQELTIYCPDNESVRTSVDDQNMVNWNNSKKPGNNPEILDFILQREVRLVEEAKEYLRDENIIP